MELGKQIKMHRQEAHLSQEELANRVYVSRQTISNWENDKSYPDVNSLVLLSEIFQISLDNLIKGDIEVMKDVIQKEEIEKMNRYGKSYTIMLIATAVSAVPLFMWLGVWAFIPWGIIWAKITHQDVGQMDMYIRMYDELKRSEGDNPTIGIVLCSDTDDDIARYSVMHGNEQLFASKYKLYLPTKEELKAEIETQKAMFYLQQQDNEDRNKNYTFNIE